MSCPYESERPERYGDFLNLEKILNTVQMKTDVHDEHLFIVIHQTYEMWFKQILFEIDSIRTIFAGSVVDEKHMLVINSRLGRVSQILMLLVDQIKILETMTPMDFWDFRDTLGTTSGFQSFQFRVLENKLGIKPEMRIQHNGEHYKKQFEMVKDEYDPIKKSEEEPSLFELVNRWLERTPGLKDLEGDFREDYHEACDKWFEHEKDRIQNEYSGEEKKREETQLKKKQERYKEIFDDEKYAKMLARGETMLSHSAFFGALLICLYRDEVIFHQGFQLINQLMDIDTWLLKWRGNHAHMVQRMLGTTAGTGGSSGYSYLRSTVSDRYRAFKGLFMIANYPLPRSYLPKLSDSISRRGSFSGSSHTNGEEKPNGHLTSNNNECPYTNGKKVANLIL